jgi:hypothetical protein
MAYLPSPEVVVPNPPLRVRDVDRRPEVISKGAPHAVVAVDRDRVIDAERARLLDDVVDGSLEEFGLFPGREVTALVDVNSVFRDMGGVFYHLRPHTRCPDRTRTGAIAARLRGS